MHTTTTAANPLAPARCLFDLNDGHPHVEAIMAPARAHAAVTLMQANTNKHAVLQAPDDALYSIFMSAPSAVDASAVLLHTARLLSGLAHVYRAARWQDTPTPRLRDEFFLRSVAGGGWTCGAICRLLQAQVAAEKLAAPGHDQTRADVMAVIRAAYRYPNVSPRTEAQLAAKGHTTAEHLTMLACAAAINIVQALQELGDFAYDPLWTDAQQACALLNEAMAVIDDGVAHTLGLDDLH